MKKDGARANRSHIESSLIRPAIPTVDRAVKRALALVDLISIFQ